MSKNTKLALRATAAAMLAASIAPILFTGTAAAQTPTGTLGGSVWFDRDSDGALDDGERGRAGAVVKASGAGGEFTVLADANGKYTFQNLPFGAYDVSHSDPAFANTTPISLNVTVDAGQAVDPVLFGVRGASICGTVWRDANGDGKRQEDEPRIANSLVGLETDHTNYTNSDADGKYCLHDIRAGQHKLGANDRLLFNPREGWTRDGLDSKFSFIDGRSIPVDVAAGATVDGFDAGYQIGNMDVRTTQLLLIWGGTTYDLKDPNTSLSIQVGDEFTIVGGVVPEGNVAEQLRGSLTLPDGLEIVDRFGGMQSHIYGQKVEGYFTERRHPGLVEFVGAKVRVVRAFSAGEIKLEAARSIYGETNLENNVLTVPFHAIEAEGRPAATTTTAAPAGVVQAAMPQAQVAETSATASLAETGANPMPILGAGVGLVAAGGVAMWFTRRRAGARG